MCAKFDYREFENYVSGTALKFSALANRLQQFHIIQLQPSDIDVLSIKTV